jgi:RNA 3'-terminal phosphate cyclase (ATP)
MEKNMSELLIIDGSHGEGGGQILRSSLALALATGRPFRVVKIRAGRAKPGLLRQHLTAVKAAAEVSGADVSGAELGSRELTFIPGPVRSGAYTFPIGSAGSTLLVVQALLPALLVGDGTFTITIEGGTHNPQAPTFDYFVRVLAPVLRRLGAQVAARLDRPGFYPAGGGRLHLTVTGGGASSRLAPLELCERGAVQSRLVTSLISALPRHVAEREIATACDRLGWDASTCGIVEAARSPGPGTAVSVEIACEPVTELFVAIGDKGVPAERVAKSAADEAAAWLAAGVPVGEHLADQLLVPLALGSGGRFRTVQPTLHTTTQIDLLRQFLGIEVVARDLDASRGVWEITVPPAGAGVRH